MPSFTPRNPAWETRLRDDFTTERYMAYLDARLTRLEPGWAEIELPYRPEVTQQQEFTVLKQVDVPSQEQLWLSPIEIRLTTNDRLELLELMANVPRRLGRR